MIRLENVSNKPFTDERTTGKNFKKNVQSFTIKISNQLNYLQMITITKIKMNNTILFEKNYKGNE